MSRRGRRILWVMIATGTLVRLVAAVTTHGIVYDIDSYRMVADELVGPHPLALYRDVNVEALRWPYPAGYFPWLAATHWVRTTSASSSRASCAWHRSPPMPRSPGWCRPRSATAALPSAFG